MKRFSNGALPAQDPLNERLNAIARMASGLSHELNNIFGAMQSNVDIMRKRLPDRSPLHTNLAHMHHAGLHAADVLRVLGIYTQQAKTGADTIPLQPLLSEAVRHFQAGMHPDIVLRVQTACDHPVVLTCRTLLHDAILAVLQNASDALPGSIGTISIETAPHVDGVPPGEGLLFGPPPAPHSTRIEISDTGEGMNPEVLQHMFEPFFSNRLRARGLGLTPVAGLVFHCNATVHVASRPGKGTVFQFLLPNAV